MDIFEVKLVVIAGLASAYLIYEYLYSWGEDE